MADYINNRFEINEIDINFVERMLKSLPSNIFFKDMEGKYVFCTHYWNHIKTNEDDPTWTIRGKYDIDIRRDRENAIKAMEEDRKIIETGRGTDYEICIELDGKTEYLQLIKNPVFDDNGDMIGIVGLINNITRTKILEKKLESLALCDQLTGLRNRAFLPIWLEKYKNDESILPLAIIMADCNGLKKINDERGHIAGDQYICMTGELLKRNTAGAGRVLRTGGDEFLVLMPNTSETQAREYMENVRAEMAQLTICDEPVSVSLGASICTESGFSIEEYIKRADEEMYREKVEYHMQHKKKNRSILDESI